MEKQVKLAVITGDLVQSTALSEKAVETRMAIVEAAANALEEWTGKTRFTRQSGDGWQITIEQPLLALRAALYIRACLKRNGANKATRMYIATGFAELDGDNLNAATEMVFVASGRGLKALPKKKLLGHASGSSISAAARLADHISLGWTPAQAKLVADALLPGDLSQKEIARRHGISQQSVQQSLAAAGLPAISDALKDIETK